MRLARAAALSGLLGTTAAAGPVEILGQPGTLTLTDTSSFNFHLDNGNIEPASSPNYDPTSDKVFDWMNRFDAQLSVGRWHAEIRLDSAVFANVPSVPQPLPSFDQCIAAPTQGACENLHLAALLENRYVNNLAFEKVSLDYNDDHFSLAAGDSYLSYGRGLVISLTKVDALGIDTTLRGANFTARGGGFSANVAAGVTNTVNTDEATGEVAPDPMDRILAARLEYRLPRVFTLGIDGAGFFQNPTVASFSSYIPGTPTVQEPIALLGLGSIGSQPPVPSAGLVDTGNFSTTLDLPRLGDFAKAYVEVALQRQWVGAHPLNSYPTHGVAAFGSLAMFLGKATVTIEAKDYQGYAYPVASSLSSVMFPAFWQQSVYNNPPLLEEQFQEETATDTIWGPRVRVDYDVTPWLRPFVAGAFFEDGTNQYDIYNASAGVEVAWQDHRSHARLATGYRDVIYNHLFSEPGAPFQQQWWAQWDVVQVLGPIYSLELEGLHRRYIYDRLTGYPWNWGFVYLSLRRSAWSATLGYEYNTQYPAEWRKDNPNAGIVWNPSDRVTLRLFAGGREAGLRCINGLCRVFPGFTGASAEVVARY